MDNQNYRGVGKYGLSFADEQILNNSLPELETSPFLVKFLRQLLLFCQRPDDQRSKNVGKKGYFFADEEDLSSSVQDPEFLSC